MAKAKGCRPRVKGVQLDLFTLVDEKGQLVIPEEERMALLEASIRNSEALPGDMMCGDRFILTGYPWAR